MTGTDRRSLDRRLFLGAALASLTAAVPAVLASIETQFTSDRVAAPELVGGPWLNTPDSKPLTLASLKGKVVLVHYWTFG